MEKKRIAGELEIVVLNHIRKRKRASVRHVFEATEGKWKYTTVMTVMQRLFEKGELARTKVGKHFEYWIDQTSRSNQSILKRLKDKVFGGRSPEMVAYLLEMDQEITTEELDEIEALIEAKRSK